MLRKAGGAEAGRDRTTYGQPIQDLEARRRLPVPVAAEVRIILETGGELDVPPVDHIQIKLGIGREILARILACHAHATDNRLEPGEHLRTGRRKGIAGRAGELRVVLANPHGACLVARQFACPDLEGLPTIFEACRQGRPLEEAGLDLAAHVQVVDPLAVAQPTAVELGRAGCAQRGIDRVDDPEIELVAPILHGQVPVPPAERALQATRQGIVLQPRGDQRQETVRIHRQHVPAVVRTAIEAGRLAVTLAIACKAIELDTVVQRHAHVHEDVDVLGLRVTVAVVQAVEGELARVVDGCHIVVPPRVEPGPVGVLSIPILSRHVHETVGAQRQADVAGHRQHRPIVDLPVLARVGQLQHAVRRQLRHAAHGHEPRHIAHAGDTAQMLAIGDRHRAPFTRIVQLEVDHPGDGVGSILGCRAVAQHLDTRQGRRRDQVDVHRLAAAAHGTVDVQQGRRMSPLAVHKNQGLVRPEAPQGCRPDHVGAVGDGGLRKVEAGHRIAQRTGGLRQAGPGQRLGRNHIHWHRAVCDRPVRPAGAGHDDRLAGVTGCPGGFLREGRRGGNHEGREKKGTEAHVGNLSCLLHCGKCLLCAMSQHFFDKRATIFQRMLQKCDIRACRTQALEGAAPNG